MTPEPARLQRWQTTTLFSLCIGYAGYYVCRSDLSIAQPLLLEEYSSAGLTMGHIGDVASLGVLFYAIGKLLNGIATEYVGGKWIFLFGMFASVACTLLLAIAPAFVDESRYKLGEREFAEFAAEGVPQNVIAQLSPLRDHELSKDDLVRKMAGLLDAQELEKWGKIVVGRAAPKVFGMPAIVLPFMAIWSVNRFVQSMGWGGLVQIASRWFAYNRMATVMSILTLSYLLGDAAARLYLGSILKLGVGWQGLFAAAAGTLGLIGLIGLFVLKNRPADLGLPEPPPPPGNVYGDDAGLVKIPLWALLAPLLKSYNFWLVCCMNAGLTLIREAFNLWSPAYFVKVVKLDAANAAIASLIFPLIGTVSALCAGWLVDRGGGRFGPVLVPSLLILVLLLVLLACLPPGEQVWLALVLIGGTAFFLLAPYTFCSGVMAVRFGGQRAGATAAGIIDTTGYLGAVLAGSGIGRVIRTYGWEPAFAILAGVAAMALAVSVVYWFEESRRKPAPTQRSDA